MRSICAKARATPSMVFVALYVLALARMSNTKEFVVTVMHTKRWRVHDDVDRIVGNFAQTVLLSVDVRGTRTRSFSDHVSRVALQLTQDLDNAAFAGTEVSQEINARRKATFQVVSPYACTSTLSFDKGGRATVERGSTHDAPPSISVKRGYSCVQVPHTWMDHQVAEDDGRLLYNFDVLAGMFPDGVVERICLLYTSPSPRDRG